MSTIWSVVKDADFLGLHEVTEECSAFLLSKLNITNCFSVLGSSQRFNIAKLSSQVEDFILSNLCQMEGTEALLSLKSSDLRRWLEDDRLAVKKEEDVFKIVMSWIQHNKEEDWEEVVGTIRFGLINKDFFDQNIASHPLMTSFTVVKEASEYMSMMEHPSKTKVEEARAKYQDLTPSFALPRLPTQILVHLNLVPMLYN